MVCEGYFRLRLQESKTLIYCPWMWITQLETCAHLEERQRTRSVLLDVSVYALWLAALCVINCRASELESLGVILGSYHSPGV